MGSTRVSLPHVKPFKEHARVVRIYAVGIIIDAAYQRRGLMAVTITLPSEICPETILANRSLANLPTPAEALFRSRIKTNHTYLWKELHLNM